MMDSHKRGPSASSGESARPLSYYQAQDAARLPTPSVGCREMPQDPLSQLSENDSAVLQYNEELLDCDVVDEKRNRDSGENQSSDPQPLHRSMPFLTTNRCDSGPLADMVDEKSDVGSSADSAASSGTDWMNSFTSDVPDAEPEHPVFTELCGKRYQVLI